MMKLMRTTTLMSFAEFELLEWGADDLELLKGELIRMPPAQNSHMDSCERLYELLKAAVEILRQTNPAGKFGRVHMERGYYFPAEPASWLKPDVSLTHPGQPGDRYYLGAPLIVFEVVSEKDRQPVSAAKFPYTSPTGLRKSG
jgi:Uma2 family endonuclease